MEFIEGQSFYETGQKPTDEEGIFLVEQAAKINGINYHPTFVYDGWAISNFLTEYERNEQNLEKEDRLAIEGFVKNFRELDINSLPHSLVHGDLISTNVMKDRNNRLYIIDFSVANSYPRIQELAVLLCDLFFDPSSPEAFLKKYNWAAGEYQKHIKLTPEELKALPIFAQAAHAMHVIGASSERVNGNTEGENSSWLELGRKGLKLSKQLI